MPPIPIGMLEVEPHGRFRQGRSRFATRLNMMWFYGRPRCGSVGTFPLVPHC